VEATNTLPSKATRSSESLDELVRAVLPPVRSPTRFEVFEQADVSSEISVRSDKTRMDLFVDIWIYLQQDLAISWQICKKQAKQANPPDRD
jgi:hypothetical protein